LDSPDIETLKKRFKEENKVVSKWETDIYFSLRKIAGGWVTTKMAHRLGTILTFKRMGINIFTPRLLSYFEEMEEQNARDTLHNLGDRKILTLIRIPNKQEPHKYMVSDLLMATIPEPLKDWIVKGEQTSLLKDHDGQHENCVVCWKIRYREEDA